MADPTSDQDSDRSAAGAPSGDLPSAEAVLKALKASERGPLKVKDLSVALGVEPHRYRAFRNHLKQMERDGTIYRVKGNRYAVPSKINLVIGRLQTTRSGGGFVRREDGGDDVFVESGLFNSAMDGDTVAVRIEGHRRGRQPHGRVIKVLERAHPSIVGTFHQGPRISYAVPRDPRMNRDIFIPAGDEGGAQTGEIVVVEIVSYGDRKLAPVGRVERVLGDVDDPGVDVLSVLFSHGLPLEFPPEVEEAGEAAAALMDEDQPNRVDRTDLLVFTIDPEDAKDHDDALSVTPLDGGLFEVGIHIADVSHFVRTGDQLDAEALIRGTSVYLVDRVVPMLPHTLSSGVCSLVPHEDRFAVSLFATLDGEGRVRESRFERTRIRSRHRLSYDRVQEYLTDGVSIDPETDSAIQTLASLARAIREKRKGRGSLDFDLPESRVILDDQGAPVDIQRRPRWESHRIVEDFMILANEIVARVGEEKKLPVLHRVHEPPSPDSLQKIGRLLTPFGYSLPMKKEVRPRDLQAVLDRARGRPEEALVSSAVLRAMTRARYDARPLGHFGLAARWYSHFTSPIRRYPDLVTHRAVVRALVEGQSIPEDWYGAPLEEAADQATRREEVAEKAERDSVDLKKVEFMERHLGEEFDGTISGVASFGLFVLLDEFFVDGLIHVSSLDDDYYVFREEEYSLVGERRRRRFRLGDRVRVQVVRVNREERKIDFLLIRTLLRSDV
jgi:ribonuclease R